MGDIAPQKTERRGRRASSRSCRTALDPPESYSRAQRISANRSHALSSFSRAERCSASPCPGNWRKQQHFVRHVPVPATYPTRQKNLLPPAYSRDRQQQQPQNASSCPQKIQAQCPKAQSQGRAVRLDAGPIAPLLTGSAPPRNAGVMRKGLRSFAPKAKNAARENQKRVRPQ